MAKKIFGLAAGFIIFVVGLPLAMRDVASIPLADQFIGSAPLRLTIAVILLIAGLSMAIATIVYMNNVGQGGPADGLGIAVSQRTKKLMTSGPYRFCRNPMLLGTFIYLLAFGFMFNSLLSFAVPIVFILFMIWEIRTFEEPRLLADFGDEYKRYKQQTPMIFPRLKNNK